VCARTSENLHLWQWAIFVGMFFAARVALQECQQLVKAGWAPVAFLTVTAKGGIFDTLLCLLSWQWSLQVLVSLVLAASGSSAAAAHSCTFPENATPLVHHWYTIGAPGRQ
jgi:hypothetical protein